MTCVSKFSAAPGAGSARRDANRQAEANPVQKLYLGNRPNFLREFAQWSKLYRDVFLRG